MLRYLVYCDFSTLKCNFKQFAEFLNGYTEDFTNLNNDIWLVNIEIPEYPFYNDLSNLAKDLESAGYADKDSIVIATEYSSINYRFAGVDESFHVN